MKFLLSLRYAIFSSKTKFDSDISYWLFVVAKGVGRKRENDRTSKWRVQKRGKRERCVSDSKQL